MRVDLDAELCQGHAMCELEAPDVFSVPKGGPVRILEAAPAEGRRAAVVAAVRYCPTQALTIVEEP